MSDAELVRYRDARQALLRFRAAEANSDTEPTPAVALVWRNLERELEKVRTRRAPEAPETRAALTDIRERAAAQLAELTGAEDA